MSIVSAKDRIQWRGGLEAIGSRNQQTAERRAAAASEEEGRRDQVRGIRIAHGGKGRQLKSKKESYRIFGLL